MQLLQHRALFSRRVLSAVLLPLILSGNFSVSIFASFFVSLNSVGFLYCIQRFLIGFGCFRPPSSTPVEVVVSNYNSSYQQAVPCQRPTAYAQPYAVDGIPTALNGKTTMSSTNSCDGRLQVIYSCFCLLFAMVIWKANATGCIYLYAMLRCMEVPNLQQVRFEAII